MTDSENQPIFHVASDDPEALQAAANARNTFRYFWRELSWEHRRIVPAVNIAAVKVPLQDPQDVPDGNPNVEQMWVSDISFDGIEITGTLINSPQWLTSIAEGDSVRLQINQMTDWMYAIMGRAYGAFSVNLIRSRMDPAERAQHDEAWGLDFGDPNNILVVPLDDNGQATALNTDHPMSINMVPSLIEYLEEDPTNIHAADEYGWTLLHQSALAGSTSGVAVLLERGANVHAVTSRGMTPLALANSLGWTGVSQMLTAHGAQA